MVLRLHDLRTIVLLPNPGNLGPLDRGGVYRTILHRAVKCTLQIKPGATESVSTCAWFLPGPDPARWLDELARAGCAAASTRLLPIARGSEDRTPAGALAWMQTGPDSTESLSGFACGRVGTKLFLPADACLTPEVTATELDALCHDHYLFLHPTLGATWFTETDFLSIWDLMEVPREASEFWNCARPGPMPSRGLSGISLMIQPTLQGLFGEESKSIGDSPIQGSPSPQTEKGAAGEKGTVKERLKDLLNQGLARVGMKPDSPSTNSPLFGQLIRWAAQAGVERQESLEKDRFKELIRLRDLLSKDPDAGLRHAIPMNPSAHRGIASPSRQLGEHGTDFDLNQLGGGGAADFWNVPPQIMQQLRTLYRELADRETKLGRYRRAAYIYAHLLGDLNSAAVVLKEGGHYREASLIYLERLHSPLAAADCLAEGGLLREASQIYRNEGRLEQAALLLEKLGVTAEAEELWRELVAEYQAKDDHLLAARLLEKRLQKREEALCELIDAWPHSAQAILCLSERIHLLTRLKRCDQVLRLIEDLKSFSAHPTLELDYLIAMVEFARRHPEPSVRIAASDLCRVVASRQLGATGIRAQAAQRVLEHLASIAGKDLLFERDTQRYLHKLNRQELERAKSVVIAEPSPVPSRGKGPTLVKSFLLPQRVVWHQVIAEERTFFALGTATRAGDEQTLHLLRGNWLGETQLQTNAYPSEARLDEWFLVRTNSSGTELLLANSLDAFAFPASDEFNGKGCTIQSLSALHGPGSLVAHGPDGYWHLDGSSGSAILRHHQTHGSLAKTWDLSRWLSPKFRSSVEPELTQIVAVGHGVAISQGQQLLLVGTAHEPVAIDLPSIAIGLAPTPAHTRAGVAVSMKTGALLQWCPISTHAPLRPPISLDVHSPAPRCCFVPNGPLVLLSDSDGTLFEVSSQGVQITAQFSLGLKCSLGLVATGEPSQFAVFDSNGSVWIYSTPS